MDGLYRSPHEASYVTDEQIVREIALSKPHEPPQFLTPLPQPRGFDYWSARLKERQRVYLETAENPNSVEIAFNDDILLNFMADLHVGGAETDYERIRQEVEAIVATPNSYAWMLGDVVDAFFFNPAQFEEIEQVQEQFEFVYAMFKYLGDNKKLLIGTAGNHCLWIKKSGVNPYTFFSEQTGAYFMHGTSYLTARVGDQEYRITGNHQFQGHSMYNNVHPQMRATNFDGGASGSDVVVGGHYHTKGVTQQARSAFGNDSQLTTYIALGTYKASDEFTKTKGFSKRQPNAMYGASVALRAGKKQVKPYYDILEAHEDFIQLSARKQNGMARG